MKHECTFAVLGSGNGARAWCAQIAAKGYSVTMWEPLEATDDFRKLVARPEIRLCGDMNLGGRLANVTMKIDEAMKGADFVLIVVPSFAHEPIFRKMIPHLRDGQNVVVVPGNFAGFRLRKIMREAGVSRKITISETASMPYACRISGFDTVTVYKRKLKLQIATSPFSFSEYVREVMNDVFDGYVEYIASDSLLSIDCDNINYTLHPLPVLLNFGAIELNSKTFRHYIDGITPEISERMKSMDIERVKAGSGIGLRLQECLSQIKMYYGTNDAADIYEYVHSGESPYFDLVGQSIKSRYITEDVPGVVVPFVQLAAKAGIALPIAELVVGLASFLHGVDYFSSGTTLEKLGIQNFSIDDIIESSK
jgi:opine dehydrogenase